MSDQASFGLE